MTTPKSNSRPDGSGRIGVLFVCLGNICRSPMAEAVFRHLVRDAGLESRFEIDSAGTSRWEVGKPASRGTRDILQRERIPHDGRARQVARDDLRRFDYILAMDRDNVMDLASLSAATDAEVALFLSYARERGWVSVDEVPDPYYDGNFERTYALVEKGSRALLEHIRQRHGL